MRRRNAPACMVNSIYTMPMCVCPCLRHAYIGIIDIRTSTPSIYVHRHRRHTYIGTVDIRTSAPSTYVHRKADETCIPDNGIRLPVPTCYGSAPRAEAEEESAEAQRAGQDVRRAREGQGDEGKNVTRTAGGSISGATPAGGRRQRGGESSARRGLRTGRGE